MIDEDLYQQAADELNSDRRIPSLWSRACSLASDDHDEARFLYTNLRVEELLAEREKAKHAPSAEVLSDSPDTDDNDSTQSFEKLTLSEDDLNVSSDLSGDTTLSDSLAAALDSDSPNLDSSVSIESFNSDTINNKPDPDAALMGDYIPETVDSLKDSTADDALDLDSTLSGDAMDLDDTISDDALDLDDTISDDDLINRDFEQELARFKAEEARHDELADNSDNNLPPASQTPERSIQAGSNFTLDHADIPTADIDNTPEHDQTNLDDLTQANVDVLSLHANDLDDMLVKPEQPTSPAAEADADMSWLENDDAEPADTFKPQQPADAIIYDDDIRSDELSRQADELDESLAAYESNESLGLSSRYDESQAYSAGDVTGKELENNAQGAPAQLAPPAPPTLDLAADQPRASAIADSATNGLRQRTDAMYSPELPLDLTQGQKGKLYSVYKRNNEAQAVKKGVSWTALFFTLPYLLYRHLFATAFTYALLWVVAVGGLIISGLAWLNAGAEVTPLTQACTIGFGLLAFIGLIYLPFRYGNEWRAERLEDRGFEHIATTRAKNPGRAISSARSHSLLDT